MEIVNILKLVLIYFLVALKQDK